ncbi:MAG: hypothetical protein LBJ81_01265 [Puniceicoccales bacterium]|nr:hypothetical protein [Puniceicoccales bacterium]
MDLKGNVKIVLCIAGDGVSLCQVADQKGRGYILSSQVVRVEGDSESWLPDALAKFDPKLLKKVKDIVFATDLISCLPLDIFYLRSVNFTRAAAFELENLLGDKCTQFQFGLWQTSEKQTAYAFLIPKVQLAQFLKIFEKFAIKNPKILLSPVMFADEAKRQVAKNFTVFLNVGRNILSFALQSGAEQHVGALPINLRELTRKISQSFGREVSENELHRVFGDGESRKMYPQIQGPLDEFFGGLCAAIVKKTKEFFKENQEITFVVGGLYDAPYGVAAHFKNVGKMQSYGAFFRSQISPAIGPEVVSALEPFIPALLSAASLDKKRLEQIVNLRSDAIAFKTEKRRHFFYEEFVAGLICCASALFYFAQKVNCQAQQEEAECKKLLARRTRLADFAGQIEAIDGRVKEQKKVLSDILVYAEQSRMFCELLNVLQGILFRAGDVYLTSFVWSTGAAKGKKADAQPGKKDAKNVKKKVAAKKVELKTGDKAEAKTQAQEVGSEAAAVASSINLSGAMFIGDVEMTQDIKQNFNDKFNAMFEQIRRLPVCAGVTDIKVNAPENCKITFRCTLQLDPQSKVIAP